MHADVPILQVDTVQKHAQQQLSLRLSPKEKLKAKELQLLFASLLPYKPAGDVYHNFVSYRYENLGNIWFCFSVLYLYVRIDMETLTPE